MHLYILHGVQPIKTEFKLIFFLGKSKIRCFTNFKFFDENKDFLNFFVGKAQQQRDWPQSFLFELQFRLYSFAMYQRVYRFIPSFKVRFTSKLEVSTTQ